MKKDGLKTIVKELKNASKMHLAQSKKIQGHIDDMKSPANRNGITVGENTGEVKKDKKGKYVLRSEASVAGEKGDTLRIKNPKLIQDGYLKGGDYKTKKISNQNFEIKDN